MTPIPAGQEPTAPDSAMLLAGPRGRRLCLELADLAATAAAPDPDRNDFHSAKIYAAHTLEPGRGPSASYAGQGADASPLPNPTAAEVAALLDALPLPVLSEAALLQALTATVNSARYWQEPDGEDILAASAPMRHALHRVAEHLLASPFVAWWMAPLDTAEQWTVTFVDDDSRPQVSAKGAVDTLAQWRLAIMAEEKDAATQRPADPTANWSGEWWSRPPSDLTNSTRALGSRGPAGLQLVEDGFSQLAAVAQRLQTPSNLRIYEIDSPEAWAQLCREHALEVTASKRHDWYRTTGRHGRWLIPDWSLLKDKYDAVHLTMGGYLSTAGREIPVDGTFSTVLAGWDPDATYWLRDAVHWAEAGQSWLQDQEGPVWTLQGSRRKSLTTPARSDWSWGHGDYRGQSETALLGTGDELWERVRADVLRWKVKTRSGFTVNTPGPVTEGARVNVTASFLGVKVVEPVEVVAVVDAADRVGFSYRTLPGHPVSGEEAFIVHRFGDDVYLTIRSLTRAAPQQPWRILFPVLLVFQKLVRRRYLRALR
ncbi:DUF1990 domain-containing protein [Arthrobacter sp. N199823]|uniref:DUF1990 domain-containing protein n=1 Tax=Arthrobacter sp. N199823 TaxID=2058895 RepID=UPI0021583AA1|nr:DUF1990 domain-containing protein [Arthrobacter sp. N199823]